MGPASDWARGRPRGPRPSLGSGCASRTAGAALELRGLGSGHRIGGGMGGDGRTRWGRGAAGAEVAPRCGPGSPAAHLLQTARGVRRGASSDRLLSRPPLYYGTIGGGAAYARCQSPTSRSGGGRPGGVGRSSSDWNRGSDVRSRDSGSRCGNAGRAGGPTDGLAEIGGQAGARGPERRGRRRSGSWGGGGCRRSGPRGARPPPAGDPGAGPGQVGQPAERGSSPVARPGRFS